MMAFCRGQKVALTNLGIGEALPVVLLTVQMEFVGGTSVDVCCFGLDGEGKLSDERNFVFYNQPNSPCGGIVATGASTGLQQTFVIDFSKLSASVRRLVFSATVDGGAAMNQISRGKVSMLYAGARIAEFELNANDLSTEKALMLAELYWKDSWRFAATGQGFAEGLSGLLRHFGGVVADETQKPATVSSPVYAPPPSPPAQKVSLTKLTLEKPGQRKSVSLQKNGSSSPIHINLNWDRAAKKSFFGGGSGSADLDLGCMYIAKDGSKGCIQALGNNFGRGDAAPFIYLDKDDRSGAASDGENLYIQRPELIEKVLVFAFIYEGAANFSNVNGRLTLHERDGSETLIRLDSPRAGATFCAICLIKRTDSGIDIIKETQYFAGHRAADQAYVFGFNWTRGSK